MKKSFTLIELLVVIAIIAILAAILLPTLKSARDSGLRSACMGNIKQLGTAHVSYCGTFDDTTASYTAPNASGTGISGTPKEAETWVDMFFPYTNNSKKVYECPAMPGMLPANTKNQPNYGYRDKDNYPKHNTVGRTGDYGVNISASGKRHGFGSGSHVFVYRKTSLFRKPSQTMLLADALKPTYGTSFTVRRNGNNLDCLEPAHGKGSNLAFFDGHGSFMSRQELEMKALEGYCTFWDGDIK